MLRKIKFLKLVVVRNQENDLIVNHQASPVLIFGITYGLLQIDLQDNTQLGVIKYWRNTQIKYWFNLQESIKL